MEIPYEVNPRRDTGLFNAKLGIWLFLASEVMLFGGLFSAYVFLRVGVIEGVDTPWPYGLNVHKTFVALGFINTLVLIISSVFVVFAWISVKERKWRRFQMFMYLTVACAMIFMALKTVEYRSKLTQHHDIKLLDNSILEGKILDRSFDVPFEGKTVEFNIVGSSPGFIADIEGDFPKFTAEWIQWEKALPIGATKVVLNSIKDIAPGAAVAGDGIAVGTTVKAIDDQSVSIELSSASIGTIENGAKLTMAGAKSYSVKAGLNKINKTEELTSPSEFRDWFVKRRIKATADLVRERKRYRREIAVREKALYKGESAPDPEGPDVNTKAKVTAAEPFALHSRRRQVHPIARTEKGDSLTYIDGCMVAGKAGDDRIKFEPHYLDMQLVPLHKQSDSMVWNVLGDAHSKEAWFSGRDKAYSDIEAYYTKRNRAIPESMLRGNYINYHSLHDPKDAPPFFVQFISDFKAGAGIGGGGHEDDAAEHDHGKEGADEHGKGPEGHATAAHADPAAHPDSDDHSHHNVLMIPRDQIKFFNSHGPRNNNYYAIYFTMTALHGLHVVAGALVLLYFVVFGKKLYLRNPEHLANRVEVGGLFWHFVDLIWIFLFPLMYLL